MMTHNAILGAGGGKAGGGEARVPVEAKDTLRSTSFAHVLDLVSEGEIDGLVNGLQSVYLDGTPIENEDGTVNFTGVTIASVNGTQSQLPIPGFSGTESEFIVNVEVLKAVPVTRTITNPNVDAVRVRIAIPGLTKQDSTTGDLNGTTVKISIDVQSNGGGFVAQRIGFAWGVTETPATTNGTGVKIQVKWFMPHTQKYASVNFDVQYRLVGAGSWTTLKQDAMTTYDKGVVQENQGSSLKRTYTKRNLTAGLYEAQVVKTSGSGTMSLATFWIEIPSDVDVITGKATSTYQRSYRIELLGSAPWDVRVNRITDDSGSVLLRNKTFFETYAELIDEQFSYPNSAIIGLSIDAAQFSAIPVRGYDLKLLRVKIPSNYNPVTREYTGIWDGTFVVSWTDNPAWCFYDLLTNSRYGLGNVLTAAQVDKWALYTIGVYCDGLVPDGLGSTEPRLTCNVYLQTQQEAFDVIVLLASVFRGMAYWAAGTVTAVQDAPADPVFLFTEANVEDGIFTYSGSAKNTRHTVVLVSWNDPSDGYKLKPEYVEDVAGIARYGVVSIAVVSVGANTRGQARRFGEWLLYSEQHETEVCTHRCGLDGMYLRPGNIYAVQDQHRAGIRFGGRILSANASSLTLDAAVTIQAGQTYTVQVVLPDGTLVTKIVTNAPGSTSVLTISVNFAVVPVPPAVWVLTSSSLSPRLYRALAITEIDRQKYEVIGLAHNPAKFDAIELGLLLSQPQTSTITLSPSPPQNVTITESFSIRGGFASIIVHIQWEPVSGAVRYRVEYRHNEGNFIRLTEVATEWAEIVDALSGYYEVRVSSINSLGISSIATTQARHIFGNVVPPSDVQNFTFVQTPTELVFNWNSVPELDVSVYEIRQGEFWEGGFVVAVTKDTTARTVVGLTGTFVIKALNTSGTYSINQAAVIVTSAAAPGQVVADVIMNNTIQTLTQVLRSPSGYPNGMTLAPQVPWTAFTSAWNVYSLPWVNVIYYQPYLSGTWETGQLVIGAGASVQEFFLLLDTPVIQTLIGGTYWTRLTSPWLYYTDPWGGLTDKVNVTVQVATTQDLSTYQPYVKYVPGKYKGKGCRFLVTLMTSDQNYVPILKYLNAIAYALPRTEFYGDFTVQVGGTTLTFAFPWVLVPNIMGTLQPFASIGDTFRITNKTVTSVQITIYNSAGTDVGGNIDVTIAGFGKLNP